MKAWLSMTKYRKFTIGNQTHSCEDCIFVKPQDDSYRDWKAQLHEVRAADEHHVFLRCSWLENPEELPEEVISTPSYYAQSAVQLRKGVEAEVNDKQQAQEPVERDHTLSVDDAAAEDSITMAKIVASEAEALKVVITDKKIGDQIMEAVHCLVCKQVVL
ncbi:hypothetical protein KCV07_g9914, partial [Aureobasidium melanogenum]